jgi:hypothetical protein
MDSANAPPAGVLVDQGDEVCLSRLRLISKHQLKAFGQQPANFLMKILEDKGVQL